MQQKQVELQKESSNISRRKQKQNKKKKEKKVQKTKNNIQNQKKKKGSCISFQKTLRNPLESTGVHWKSLTLKEGLCVFQQ